MKRILLLLALFSTLAASAQFPSKDSLQRYINRWIRNSAVDAFTNLRLNTALNGLLTEIKGVATTNSGIANVIIDGDSLRIITTLPDTFSVYYPTGGAVATNLSVSRTTTQVNVQSSTGTTGILPPASQFFAGVMTAADKTALDSAVSRAVLRDSVGQRLRDIYRRGDSVFYITSGAETFAFLADASVGSGTVTSVGSGYGLSGGPITTTGALVVDSAALSLKYLRRADSLTAYTSRYRLDTANAALRTLIAGKLNNITGLVGVGTGLSIVGTGVAGDPYLLSNVSSGGTVTSVGSGYGLTGGPITGAGSLVVDTATLAARFLRRGDTALIFTDYRNAINARMKYTDTVSLSDRINAKGSGTVTSVSFTDGGGFDGTISNATTTPTISITQQNSAADGATKGQSGFAAADFNGVAGIMSIDWVNTQKASSSLSGALSASDWIDFNAKISNITGLVTAGTNVSITGAGTSGSPYVINATPGGGGSGTVNSGLANTLAYYASNGTVVDDLAAITASRALVSNVNGLPVASSVTSTELGYVSGVTSGIQTQLNGKQATITTGSTAQYFRGDFSLATFPTNVSTFTNDASYLTNITGKVSAGTNISVTGLGTTASPYVINSSAGTTYTGTTNRLTVTGSVLDIAATYVGQTSITTLGTIGVGTWNGTKIGMNYGGVPTGGTTNQMLVKINNTDNNVQWVDQPAGGGGVSSVSGTTNRITSTGGATPVIDIASTYVGQTSLTTLGTVTTGTWTATPIATIYGGVPAGGSVGQILAKINGSNYNTQWIPAPTGTVYEAGYGVTIDGENNITIDTATLSAGYIRKGNLVAGANITITPAGNQYVIASSGGSGLSDGDKGDITVSSTGSVFTVDNGAITNVKVAAGLDAVKLADGSVTNAEFQFINSLTSNAQTQLDAKQATLVSGSNIRTINGNTILGSTDLVIPTLSDGDKTDITVSASGATYTIDAGAVTDTKVATGINANKSVLTGYSTPASSNTGVSSSDNVTQAITKVEAQLKFINPGYYKPENYGAIVDDGIDDAAAFTAMFAAMPSTGGNVILQTGAYRINTAVTITKPFKMAGRGVQSVIETTSSTINVFTLNTTQYGAQFEGITFQNLATTPTAGSAIKITGSATSDDNLAMRLNNIWINNFYDNLVIECAVIFAMDKCVIYQPLRYGILLKNILNPDSGDSYISNSTFIGNYSVLTEALIRYTSSGGLKLINNKFNAGASAASKYFIDVNIDGNTADMLMANNSLENYGISAIRITADDNEFRDIVITGNQISPYNVAATGPAIDISNVEGVSIVGNTIRRVGTSNNTAILLTDIETATLLNTYLDFTTQNPVVLAGTNTNILNLNSPGGSGGGDMLTSAQNLMTEGSQIVFPYDNGNSSMRVGGMEFQGTGLNDGFITDNLVYNGVNVVRRSSGPGFMMYFGSSGLNFYTTPTGSAGTTATLTSQFFIGPDGVRQNAGSYYNWGTVLGTTGYGLWDDAGTMKYKNNGGSWTAFSSGGGGTPGGSNTQIQFNNSGAFGASASLTYDGTAFKTLSASAGLVHRVYTGSASYYSIYPSGVTPGISNFFFTGRADGTEVTLNSTDYLDIAIDNASVISINPSRQITLPDLAGNGAGYLAVSNTGLLTWAAGSGGGGGDMLTTAQNTMGSGGQILFPVQTTNSSIKMGSMELQNLGVNDSYVWDNLVYDGTAIKYRANGFGTAINQGSSGFNFFTAPSGSAGGTATVTSQFFVGVNGTRQNASSYNNYGSTIGSGGYGIRDNAGTMEFKNSGGTWTAFGSGGGGGYTSPLTTTGDLLSYSSGTHVRVAAGTSGYYLGANGAGVLPSWKPLPGSGNDATYAVFSTVTTGATGSNFGDMTVSSGESGWFEITVYAINSSSNSSYGHVIKIPYLATSATTISFGTEIQITVPDVIGSALASWDGVDVWDYGVNATTGDLTFNVSGMSGQNIQWRIEVRKHTVTWSS